MSIRVLIFIALLLAGAATAAGQKPCERYSELGVSFSACPPEGWVVQARVGEEFKIFTGPGAGNFRPNINFREEASNLSLEDYVDASSKVILGGAEKLGAKGINLKSKS